MWGCEPNEAAPNGGSRAERVQWTKQRGEAGAALRFSQAPSAARRKNRLSARGLSRSRGGTPLNHAVPSARKGCTTLSMVPSPKGGSRAERVQWTKQRGEAGAALRFSQAPSAARRKNRLSARGLSRSDRGDFLYGRVGGCTVPAKFAVSKCAPYSTKRHTEPPARQGGHMVPIGAAGKSR